VSSRRVDLLNIGLMLGSCGLAFALPFDLFLFSYAVLGPLHYLTEISWLHKRDYFLPRRRDALLLVVPLALLLAAHWGKDRWGGIDMALWGPVLNAAGLGLAVALVATRDPRWRAGIVAAAVLAGWTFADRSAVHDLLRVLLPTLIHVWVFTGAFVLLGALRGRSPTGLASLAVFVACSAACFVIQPGEWPVQVRGAYTSITGVNEIVFGWMNGRKASGLQELLTSPPGRGIVRFIAFAYTYHYLNWFSKTSIIQWHKIPLAWTCANLGLWAVSVALYAYDYALGLAVLFGLSYLHVYLELPLNGRSFAGIGRELTAWVRGQPAGAGAGAGARAAR
jgi:hypothetical protein